MIRNINRGVFYGLRRILFPSLLARTQLDFDFTSGRNRSRAEVETIDLTSVGEDDNQHDTSAPDDLDEELNDVLSSALDSVEKGSAQSRLEDHLVSDKRKTTPVKTKKLSSDSAWLDDMYGATPPSTTKTKTFSQSNEIKPTIRNITDHSPWDDDDDFQVLIP